MNPNENMKKLYRQTATSSLDMFVTTIIELKELQEEQGITLLMGHVQDSIIDLYYSGNKDLCQKYIGIFKQIVPEYQLIGCKYENK